MSSAAIAANNPASNAQYAQLFCGCTQAESAEFAYAVLAGKLQPIKGGNWRNAVKRASANDDASVVAVSFQDAMAYCRFKGERLPTEDEWEYIARSPERHTFPWGEDLSPAKISATSPPSANDGPVAGMGGHLSLRTR